MENDNIVMKETSWANKAVDCQFCTKRKSCDFIKALRDLKMVHEGIRSVVKRCKHFEPTYVDCLSCALRDKKCKYIETLKTQYSNSFRVVIQKCPKYNPKEVCSFNPGDMEKCKGCSE